MMGLFWVMIKKRHINGAGFNTAWINNRADPAYRRSNQVRDDRDRAQQKQKLGQVRKETGVNRAVN
jgi:hypothetical protein